MSVLGRAMVAFAVAAAGTWVATRVARRVGLVDRPGPRKMHAAPIPLGGGVAVGAGLTAGVAGGAVPVPLLAAVWGLVAVGLIDDARDLRARTRLAAQVAASLPVAILYAPQIGLPRPLEAILALLFLLAVMNAIKCIDSADAVASSVAVTAALSLGWLNGWEGPAGMASAALTGAAAGFLILNVPPARCFLGEAGSTVLGFVLASIALATTAAASPDRSLSVAVATATVLTVPVLDFVVVHARRARAGVRRVADLMASTGTDHLPHRLRAAGLGASGVAVVCAGAVAVSGVAARLAIEGDPATSLIGALGLTGVLLGVEVRLQAGRSLGRVQKRDRRRSSLSAGANRKADSSRPLEVP